MLWHEAVLVKNVLIKSEAQSTNWIDLKCNFPVSERGKLQLINPVWIIAVSYEENRHRQENRIQSVFWTDIEWFCSFGNTVSFHFISYRFIRGDRKWEGREASLLCLALCLTRAERLWPAGATLQHKSCGYPSPSHSPGKEKSLACAFIPRIWASQLGLAGLNHCSLLLLFCLGWVCQYPE